MKKLLLVMSVCFLAACSKPTTTDIADAKALVDSMTYVKAKNGLCFGVATYERLSTSISLANHLVITSVDCKAVGL